MGRIPRTAVGTFDNIGYERPRKGVAPVPAVVDWMADPVAFARRAGLEPDEPQMRVLRSTAQRGILNCSRQWGKSTVAAAKALHHAWAGPKRTVVAGCPTERQSAEFMKKVEGMARQLRLVPKGDGVHSVSLLLENGSRIVGLPQNEEGIRGISAVTLLVIDEASRVTDSFYKALRPMLSTTNGAVWLMSTPCEKSGFFYEAWAHGGEKWERLRVTAIECPRISKEFLEEELSELGQAWFRQEYMAEFMDLGGGYFGRDLVEAALTDDLAPVALDMRRH